jgi:regulatory protein
VFDTDRMSRAASPYLDGIKMLARRELSEAQVRERLERRGHQPRAIDAAIDRLKDEGAINDARVAAAIARRETTVRRHGKFRVRRQIERAGIALASVHHVLDEVLGSLDEDALIQTALRKRLDDREAIRDDAQFARLYRYLLGQGFEGDAIVRALKGRSVK